LIFTNQSFSQLKDSTVHINMPEYPSIERSGKCKKENWTVHLSNDTVYHDVRLVYILGDSIMLARGNSKSFFHIKDIKSILFNGKQWPIVVGFFGGLLSGGVIGGLIANANKPEKKWPDVIGIGPGMSVLGGILLGALVGVITGTIIGASNSSDNEEFDIYLMTYKEKIMAIKTEIFGLVPYE
jgi:hypothetical protein